jgi:hypothetical protein
MATPPILGADIELGNAWTGGGPRSNLDAARLVLNAVRGVGPARGFAPPVPWIDPFGEGGRHWLANGGSIYIDMSHLEVCPPETASARDHAAAFHAMLRLVRAARRRAVASLPEGEDLFVNAHVTDGTLSTSWGAHLDVTTSRPLWHDLLGNRRPHRTALLAAIVAALVPLFGQGAVLPFGGGCRFVTSARAMHLGDIVTLATTEAFRRGLLNSRDEPHAGDDLARLHLIAFDTNLQPASIFLRCGLLQLALAAMEAGWFDAGLLLDDPVAAARAWSFALAPDSAGPQSDLAARPQGGRIGLVDFHRRLLVGLRRVVDRGEVTDAVVPEGRAILDLFAETLDDVERRDLPRLARRLDWALKWQYLEELGPDLDDPRLRLLDQYYSHVDDRVGLFWTAWREGQVDRIIDDAAIGRFMTAGDPHSRSSLRGELVRRLRPWITDMDWSYIEVGRPRGCWPRYARVELPDPALPGGARLAELRQRYPDDAALLNAAFESADPLNPRQGLASTAGALDKPGANGRGATEWKGLPSPSTS